MANILLPANKLRGTLSVSAGKLESKCTKGECKQAVEDKAWDLNGGALLPVVGQELNTVARSIGDEPVEFLLEVTGVENLEHRPRDSNDGRDASSDQVGGRLVNDRDEGECERPDVVADHDGILLLGENNPEFSSNQYQRLESLENRLLTPDEGEEGPKHKYDQ